MSKGASTRQRIEQAAIDLFAKQGFDGTSMREIATAVGVSEAALYRHFSGKQRMGAEIFRTHYQQLAGQLRQTQSEFDSVSDQIAEMIRIFCRAFDRDRSLFRFLLLSQHQFAPSDSNQRGEVFDVISGVLNEGMQAGEFCRQDTLATAAMVIGTVLQAALFSLHGWSNKSMKEIESDLIELVLRALKENTP